MKLPFLKSRPANTLLYITEGKTFRVDMDKHGVMQGELEVLELRCDSTRQLANTLENILEVARPLAKKVWLMYVRLPTQVFSLPSVQVAGAEEEMLKQALLFEYESLTGETVTHSHLAYHLMGDADEMSEYWVTVLAKETFTKITEALKSKGCKLAGLLHPGGLPVVLGGEKAASWLRIETWSNTVFAINQTVDEDLSLQVFQSEENSNWQTEVDHWILETGEVARSETLMNNKVEYLPLTDESLRLTVDASLEFWLGRWADYLVNAEAPAIPLLNIQRKVNMDLVFMLGGGGLALALCVAHFTWNLYQRNEFSYKVEELTKTEKDMKSARAGGKKTQTENEKLETILTTLRSNVKVIPQMVSALQERPMLLLKGLAEAAPEDLIIESITINEDKYVEIKGVALQSHLINQLASGVKGEFVKLAWQVEAPTKTDLGAFETGGPWEFSLLLKDQGLEGFVQE